MRLWAVLWDSGPTNAMMNYCREGSMVMGQRYFVKHCDKVLGHFDETMEPCYEAIKYCDGTGDHCGATMEYCD